MQKKIISVILALVLITGLIVPVTAATQTEEFRSASGAVSISNVTDVREERIALEGLTHTVVMANGPATVTVLTDAWLGRVGSTAARISGSTQLADLTAWNIDFMFHTELSLSTGYYVFFREYDYDRVPAGTSELDVEYWYVGMNVMIPTGSTFVLTGGIYLLNSSENPEDAIFVVVSGTGVAGDGAPPPADPGALDAPPDTAGTGAPENGQADPPPPPPTTGTLDNTASGWAVDSLLRSVELGLVPQNLQSNFQATTSRAEFTALAITLYEVVVGEVTGRVTFVDTNDIYVQKAAYLGIVQGVGDDRFDPNSPLTREMAAVLTARLANAMGYPFPEDAPTFADNTSISVWARDGVGQAQAAGIMGGVGDNRFAPLDPYTCEQSIITMLRLFDMIG